MKKATFFKIRHFGATSFVGYTVIIQYFIEKVWSAFFSWSENISALCIKVIGKTVLYDTKFSITSTVVEEQFWDAGDFLSLTMKSDMSLQKNCYEKVSLRRWEFFT